MDKLRQAWRHHRIRMGRIPASAADFDMVLAPVHELTGHVTTRDVARVGYFEILAAAGVAILERESHDEDPLPLLLVASGAVQ